MNACVACYEALFERSPAAYKSGQNPGYGLKPTTQGSRMDNKDSAPLSAGSLSSFLILNLSSFSNFQILFLCMLLLEGETQTQWPRTNTKVTHIKYPSPLTYFTQIEKALKPHPILSDI